MPLYAGVWYAEWPVSARVGADDVHRGLIVLPAVLDRLCETAAGAPVTWEHSAMATIVQATPGSERSAALAHGQVAGTVKAAWVEARTGWAHAVFEIADTLPMVCALLDSKLLRHLSATHVVGQSELIELSLTNTPARPGCNIVGRVPSIAEYIAIHAPERKAIPYHVGDNQDRDGGGCGCGGGDGGRQANH